jgi:uncharacterized BrkB/YihY/UPF0761 family membrane protein
MSTAISVVGILFFTMLLSTLSAIALNQAFSNKTLRKFSSKLSIRVSGIPLLVILGDTWLILVAIINFNPG